MTIQEIRKLPPGVRYDVQLSLAPVYHIVMRYTSNNGMVTEFYISSFDYVKADPETKYKCYGKTPWGPWCELTLRWNRVIHVWKVEDPAKIQELNAELAESRDMMKQLNREWIGDPVVMAGEELFRIRDDHSRLTAIRRRIHTNKLQSICNQFLSCHCCPLAVQYKVDNEYRFICTEEATDERLTKIFRMGGKFVKRMEKA